MKSKAVELIAIIPIITVGLLVVTVGIGVDGNAQAKQYKKTQTIAQVNNCGNYILPTNITCSNSDSEVQGNQNSLNSIAFSLLPFP
jgi:hypothetical protein